MDSREPSYYEIALTNRQVVGVFAILLVSVLVAFLAGVWVGRDDGAPIAEPLAIEPYGLEESPEGEALGELNFFSDSPERAPRREPPAVARTPPAAAANAEPPAESADELPREAGAAAATGDRQAAAEAPAAEPPTDGGALVVQVFSSADRDQAQLVVDRLRAAGFAALLSPVEVESRTLYRVRIGPFAERAEAEQVAARVRRELKLDTWITR